MIVARALRLARLCMEKEIRRLAANANLHDVYHLDTPACIEASKQRQELREALQLLGDKKP